MDTYTILRNHNGLHLSHKCRPITCYFHKNPHLALAVINDIDRQRNNTHNLKCHISVVIVDRNIRENDGDKKSQIQYRITMLSQLHNIYYL